MKRTRIKLCGTTRKNDALEAVRLGVDALGFIFYEKSPRAISVTSAARIIAAIPPFVSCVGVFVNSSRDTMQSVITMCGLTQVQLHGDESVETCTFLKNWNKSLSICKAFRIGPKGDQGKITPYLPHVDSVLLDTYKKGIKGGTGDTFDWNLLKGLPITGPLILAGGLQPENVFEALQAVGPYAVDVNSGVEVSPGIKDHQKLHKFITRVRDFDQQ